MTEHGVPRGIRPLLVATEFVGGDPAQGLSWAQQNLLMPLRQAYPATMSFDYQARMNAVGRTAMNEELERTVAAERPDVTILVPRTDQLIQEVVASLGRWTTTVAYFFDDAWRRRFSDGWARHVDLVTTPEQDGIVRFRRSGVRNAVVSPFPFNEDIFVRKDLAAELDVSFVGQYHPHREWIVRTLERSGVRVSTFGPGWPSGTVSQEDLVRIINVSRINLNLSNSTHIDPGYLLSSPLAMKWTLRELTRGESKRHEQVKGRHFEIAGCGGFQLSYWYAGVAEHFVPGREIEMFRDSSELVRKVHHYLEHENERARIADAGWRRAHAHHTGIRRVRELVEMALASKRRES